MLKLRNPKKKFGNSYNIGQDCLNTSSFQEQPRKTVVVENSMLSQNKQIRFKKPSNVSDKIEFPNSSTPYKYSCESGKANLNKSNVSQFGNNSIKSFDDVEDPFDSVPLGELIGKSKFPKSKLGKSTNCSSNNLHSSSNRTIEDLEDELDRLKLNETLEKKLEKMDLELKKKSDKFSMLRESLTKLEDKVKMNKNAETMNQDVQVKCLLCVGKICKNMTGFNIHFSKIHKGFVKEERKFYFLEMNSNRSTEDPICSNTPVPPQSFKKNFNEL
ncbi:unnamed protein product [Brachionus calyciflorus]|uniref:Uncharacterized protein n=1 Tax=Brachionus calyciflorus TaxID=104777 RepID=A0A813VJ03_9BILA|nr:unnamed protein product [Brachionus calyciflorus]